MTRSDADNTEARPPLPPRPLSPQERGDAVLRAWRLARATALPVLADLLGSGDFPAEVLDPDRAASIIVERLLDAALAIVPAEVGHD